MILLSNNLKAFLKVVERKTVVAAAADLGLTQTGVTQRLKSLEGELKATLFIRSRKGMELTPEGQAVLHYCLRANELEGAALSFLSKGAQDQRVTIRLAGPTSLVSSRIVDQIKPIYDRWPKLELSLVIDDGENRIHHLKNGTAHLAILRPDQVVDEFDSKLLKPERFSLVGHPKWKGKKLENILAEQRMIDFHEGDITTVQYLKHFDLLKFVKGPRIFSNENQALTSLFCAGIGYGTLIREIAEPLVQSGELVYLNGGEEVTYPIALAWYPRAQMPGYFKDLIRAMK